MKDTQAMMTTTSHHVVPQHEGICVSFLTYGIRLKPISNPLVGDANLAFVVPLKSNGMFIYVYVIPKLPAPLEFVAYNIQPLLNLTYKLL